MSKDTFDYQYELILKEMEFLQNAIGNYNTISMTVKGWAITIVGGLLVLSLQRESISYIALAPVLIVLFWIVDGVFKSIQRVFIFRYNTIENHLRLHLVSAVGKRRFESDFVFPAIGSSVTLKDARGRHRIYDDALKLDTSLPYVAMLLVSSLVALVMLIAS